MDIHLSQPSPSSNALARFLRGVGSTGLSQILSAANAILLVPLCLRAWGVDVYGRWLALTALISYLTLLDLGGQSFIGNLLARAYANQEEAEFRRRLSEGVSLFAVMALTVFAALVCVLAWPRLTLPGQTQVLNSDERLIVLFLSIPILIGIPGGVYATAYRATGCLARGMMVSNTVKLIGLLSFVLILGFGLSPLTYAIAALVQSVVLGSVMIWDLLRHVSFARRTALNLQMAWEGRKHLSGSLLFWLLALGNALNYQGIILVLNAVVAPGLIALYVTQRTAAGLIGYISSLLQTPLWAELTFLHARQRWEELVRVVLVSVKVVSLLTSLAAAGLWMLIPIIYPLWTNGQLSFDPLLFGVLLVQTVLFAEWSSCGWVLMASNHHRSLAGWAFGNAVITLGLAALLAPRFNILGVAFATLAGDMVCGLLVYPRQAARMLKVPAYRLYMSMFLPMSVILLLGLVILKLVEFLSPVMGLLVAGTVLVAAAILTLQFVFTRNEMDWLRSNLKQLGRPGQSYQTGS